MRPSALPRERASRRISYLEYRREEDEHGIDERAIVAALELFWYERARTAPSQRALSND